MVKTAGFHAISINMPLPQWAPRGFSPKRRETLQKNSALLLPSLPHRNGTRFFSSKPSLLPEFQGGTAQRASRNHPLQPQSSHLDFLPPPRSALEADLPRLAPNPASQPLTRVVVSSSPHCTATGYRDISKSRAKMLKARTVASPNLLQCPGTYSAPRESLTQNLCGTPATQPPRSLLQNPVQHTLYGRRPRAFCS